MEKKDKVKVEVNLVLPKDLFYLKSYPGVRDAFIDIKLWEQMEREAEIKLRKEKINKIYGKKD